jgi:hypothetical protein
MYGRLTSQSPPLSKLASGENFYALFVRIGLLIKFELVDYLFEQQSSILLKAFIHKTISN